MTNSRLQPYKYSSKVAGVGDKALSTYLSPSSQWGVGIQLINPINLLTIEALTMHLRASSITAGATIIAIGIADADVNPLINVKTMTVSIPQVSGVIDFTKSLAGILLPTKNNVINLIFDRNTAFTCEMWKADMLYTVLGVK